jgi:8-oxo-dGTP pyrophosphatase MutT (NUDIX family)
MSSGQWYPPEWPERIRALANGSLTVVAPRRAATVMLLRDEPPSPGTGGTAGRGFAVHMLRRRTSMPFAAGAYAYPGGGVDPRDHDRTVGWAGPSLAWWAGRLGVDEATAQAVVCAAVRETYEESGVLLAGPGPDALVDDITGPDWAADRAALTAHELSFAQFLARRGLLLRSDLLAPWARWITPEFEARRYDTWFFAAALPAGQRTAHSSNEADRTVWVTPADAAARYDTGELTMLPPTIATLRQLSACSSVGEVLAAGAERDMTAVLARARLDGDEVVLTWPGFDEFTRRVPGRVPGPGASGEGAV